MAGDHLIREVLRGGWNLEGKHLFPTLATGDYFTSTEEADGWVWWTLAHEKDDRAEKYFKGMGA